MKVVLLSLQKDLLYLLYERIGDFRYNQSMCADAALDPREPYNVF